MNRYLYQGVREQAGASRQRLEDASVLLNASRWRCSMYVAGYAVECLLKTKLMQIYNCRSLTELETELHRRSILAENDTIFMHQLDKLIKLVPGHNRILRNRGLLPVFNVINRWTPQWRYSNNQSDRQEATEFMTSVERIMHWIDANI